MLRPMLQTVASLPCHNDPTGPFLSSPQAVPIYGVIAEESAMRPGNSLSRRMACFMTTALLGFFALSGCGGSSHVATRGSSTSATATATLRTTSVAWAHALLVGSLDEIATILDSKCAWPDISTAADRKASELYLQHIRTVLRSEMQMDLKAVKIRSVALRNVTASSGEALVEYELPPSAVGIENWVNYRLNDGQWRVVACQLPVKYSPK
jgi:hypothetical protein